MALLRYRCTRATCRMRLSLPRPPETYRREKQCPCCRGRLALDHWRHANEVGSQTRTGVCHCSGWPFPHRRGSVWCEHGRPPTDEQMAERYGWDALEDAL